MSNALMKALKAARESWNRYGIIDTVQGIEVNNLVKNNKVSSDHEDFSPYSSDSYYYNSKRVGINNCARSVNRLKCLRLSRHTFKVNGRF